MNIIKIANHTFYIDDVYIEDGNVKALVFDIDSKPEVESSELFLTSVKDAEAYLINRNYWAYVPGSFEEYFKTEDYISHFRDAFVTAIIDQYPGVKKNIVNKWRFLLAMLVVLHISLVYLLVHFHYIAAPVMYMVCMLWLSHYAHKNKLL